MADETQRAVDLYGGAVALVPGGVTVRDPAKLRSAATDRLVWQAVFAEGEAKRGRALAALGAGAGDRGPTRLDPGLYVARGRGDVGGFTVPAINVRVMAYDTARAIFRAARAGQGRRDHPRDRPLGDRLHRPAARRVRVGHDRRRAPRGLRPAAVHPGRPLPGQPQEVSGRPRGRGGRGQEAHRRGGRRRLLQHRRGHLHAGGSLARRRSRSSSALNYERAAEITAFIRGLEPEGVTVSVGAEIGEVGMKNSTVEELHAFMQGYNRVLAGAREARRASARSRCRPGPSHGGVVLPDGSMADVKLDLQALAALSTGGARGVRAGRGGAARRQHAAVQRLRQLSPDRDRRDPPRHQLPEHRLRPSQAADRAPRPAARAGWTRTRPASGRAGDTAEQFYYKARKKAIGPFKREMWSLARGGPGRHRGRPRAHVRVPVRAAQRQRHREGHQSFRPGARCSTTRRSSPRWWRPRTIPTPANRRKGWYVAPRDGRSSTSSAAAMRPPSGSSGERCSARGSRCCTRRAPARRPAGCSSGSCGSSGR